MVLGVDFDNTIVRYDDLFHRVALERGLIPPTLPATKTSVREYLRREGREDDWTALQGYVYGPRMGEAQPFPGVIEFLTACVRSGVAVRIISHKTRHPFLGPAYDLHQAARDWLVAHRFFEADGVNLADEHVRFELTKQDKLRRIGELGCTHFIDDLPELLAEPAFPASVERILFDPAGTETGHPFRRVESWPALASILSGVPAPDAGLAVTVRRLLDLGDDEAVALDAVAGGGNNRGFRVTARGERYFVKAYFHGALDTRDRLEAEFAFSRAAWERGVRALPRPIACDRGAHVGVYEFVEGTPVAAGGATADRVREAIDFHRDVNRGAHDGGIAVPDAAEACFSLDAHAACVARRVRALEGIVPASDVDRAAAEFVQSRLIPAWTRVRGEAERLAGEQGLSWSGTLASDERVLSASDFGFHNAIVRPGGALAFVDFEYAGWDDPAKLVSDFFCQPAVPVSAAYRDWVVDAVFDGRPGGDRGRRRAAVLWPVYRLKWICILLNEFLPHTGARRRFARPAADWETLKVEQLQKARGSLDALTSAGAPHA